MKTLLVAFMTFFSIQASHAGEIFLTSNSAGTENWYGYPDTFRVTKDYFIVLVAKRFTGTQKADARMYLAVSKMDCSQGFGSLFSRENPDLPWVNTSQFSIEADHSVADIIVANMCNAGKTAQELAAISKKQTAKKDTKKPND